MGIPHKIVGHRQIMTMKMNLLLHVDFGLYSYACAAEAMFRELKQNVPTPQSCCRHL